MKAPKEIRNWVNRRRAKAAKPNGVVPWLWDAPAMERKLSNNKRIKEPEHV